MEVLLAADQALQDPQQLERTSVPVTPSTPTAQTPAAPPRGVAASEDEVSVASTASVPAALERRSPPPAQQSAASQVTCLPTLLLR